MTDGSPETLKPEDWAGETGARWNDHIDRFESMISAVGKAAIEFAEFKPGESVIDIGCGGAPSAVRIAELVGSNGHVTGIDVSQALIDTARARQKELDAANLDFLCADAATYHFDRRYDCLFSRFGVMFFDEPYAAFANLATAVKPGGRIALCCWGPPPANPWVSELIGVISRHVEPPPRDPKAPGPFAFGDREYFTDVLEQAGFTDPAFTVWKGDQHLGGIGAGPEEAAQFALEATFIGDLLDSVDAETRSAATADLIEFLQGRQTDFGITMKGTAWLVAANAG